MIQRSQHLRFALEARQAIDVTRKGVGQHLNRDIAIQPRIARAIHLAHAAGADEADHFVRAETIAGRQ